ncbi:MAG: hypothetical protein LBL00_03835 [Endomicrobium sp.]|jgi:hypothetical protein|nr:hypothetical protein [Endomicrobium sp.]
MLKRIFKFFGNNVELGVCYFAEDGTGARETPPAAPQVTTAPAVTPNSTDIFAGLSDEHKAFAQNKGWKDIAGVVGAYMNAEKLIGAPAEEMLRMPKADSKPEEWDAFYARLGKPATVEDYKIELPQGADDSFLKTITPLFLKNGLTLKQAQGLTKDYNDMAAKLQTESDAAYKTQTEGATAKLRSEFGQSYDSKVELGRRAAQAFGFTPDEISGIEKALGFENTMRRFIRMGEAVTEEAVIKNLGNAAAAGGFGMSPAQAQAKIEQLKTDKEWTARYIAGGLKERQEMDGLLRIITGDK